MIICKLLLTANHCLLWYIQCLLFQYSSTRLKSWHQKERCWKSCDFNKRTAYWFKIGSFDILMAFWQSKHRVINTGFFFRARVRSCGSSQSVTGLYKQQFQFHQGNRCQPFHSKQNSEPYPLILWVIHPNQREALRSPPTLQTGSTGALRNSRVRLASRTRTTWNTSTQFFPLRDLHLWARWNIHWKAENRYR